jgi:myosin heavy subunit
VKKLTELTNRLEMEKNGERAAQADAIKEALKQLRQPGPGPLDEFSRALARGDFNKAKEQLAELSKQLAEGSMNPEQAQLTKKQLEDLAKQLEKIAKEQQRLEKKLEQQGLDRKSAAELAKAAATSPEAMQKALEQQKNLSEEQKQKLMEMAKAMSKCQGACQSMSAALSKAAQGMSQEGLSQEGMEGLEQLAQELSESEMLEADMENLEAALSEAKKQLRELGESLAGNCEGGGECEGAGSSEWRSGSSDRMGRGSGGPGRGNDPYGPDAEPADFTLEKKKANTQTTAGPIIGTRLVNGPQVKGESVAEFAQGVAQGAQETAESIESQEIPREMQDAVKHYFGRLDAKVKEAAAKAPEKK